MTTISQNRTLKHKNKLTLQQINDQLKSLEDQKLQLIQSIFKYSTESQLTIAKLKPMETEDQKISEISTAIQGDDKSSADALAKESHLYQKMASLLSNNGSLHALSVLCQEELGKIDQMMNFPLELKVLNGISKLESLQSLKKQKRKSKRKNNNNNNNTNNNNNSGVSKRSRRIKKEMNNNNVNNMPGIKNIIEDAENKMMFNNDIVQLLFQDCQPEFENENDIYLRNNIQQERKNSLADDFFQNNKISPQKIDETNILNENQFEKQLEIVHNPNDSTRDQTKITELHNYISVIEGMLSETKEQLQQILN